MVGGKIKVTPLGNLFLLKMLALSSENALAPFSGGVSDTRPKKTKIHRMRSVCVFLIPREPENLFDPTFSEIKKTEEKSGRSLFPRLKKHRSQIGAFSQGVVSCTRGTLVVLHCRGLPHKVPAPLLPLSRVLRPVMTRTRNR